MELIKVIEEYVKATYGNFPGNDYWAKKFKDAYKIDSERVAGLKNIVIKKPAGLPTIVCLCGSTRFVDLFNHYRKEFTYCGCIVLSIEIVTSQIKENDPQFCDKELKKMLDELHLRKIDLADIVFFINKDGYIGESTRKELDYCIRNKKRIEFMECEPVSL